eukprot:CAMPEP_0197716650 /NCGR_PEP_ID=MMETSP1434-20131217/1463_1 /TAXON_ID=265543 /ORGANISM="Minutocellus polymorphus, Strain CCMP3303" /LENGTH=270 /DNA_ID=CAMNT_0043301041 /DNA_START=52 /DNA_END=864 /DNA_ORIENTATION=+
MIKRAANQVLRGFSKQTAAGTVASNATRALSAKSPGANPLELLAKESERRHLCDHDGYRTPGSHWTMALAAAGETTCHAPNLRTVNIQRISSDGVGFVTKRAAASASCPYANSNPISFLYTVGKYKPGETVEQWRAEGSCVPMELGTILDRVPHYSIAETVATARLIAEKSAVGGNGDGAAGGTVHVSDHRTSMGNQSHFTELVQKTRVDLENGRIADEELEACLGAWTFEPRRLERMDGGPDAIMWNRWEWLLSDDGKDWTEANHILPY